MSVLRLDPSFPPPFTPNSALDTFSTPSQTINPPPRSRSCAFFSRTMALNQALSSPSLRPKPDLSLLWNDSPLRSSLFLVRCVVSLLPPFLWVPLCSFFPGPRFPFPPLMDTGVADTLLESFPTIVAAFPPSPLFPLRCYSPCGSFPYRLVFFQFFRFRCRCVLLSASVMTSLSPLARPDCHFVFLFFLLPSGVQCFSLSLVF